uniref:Ig-like domain-containing protein n=1 Tax=Salarias fasciatus TaxID=181472 RepID=A0A672FP36_SALFA
VASLAKPATLPADMLAVMLAKAAVAMVTPVTSVLYVVGTSRSPFFSTIISAVGQNVTLPCQVLNYSGTFDAVMWNRPDLEKNHYVFLFKDGHINPEDQHDIYKNRVELKDRTMKDGDVSLIVKEVTFNDSGIFQCFIQRETNNTDTDNNELITSISLSVVPPGQRRTLLLLLLLLTLRDTLESLLTLLSSTLENILMLDL